jgi:hypothetical protein
MTPQKQNPLLNKKRIVLALADGAQKACGHPT